MTTKKQKRAIAEAHASAREAARAKERAERERIVRERAKRRAERERAEREHKAAVEATRLLRRSLKEVRL